VDAFARAVLSLADDPAGRRRLGEAARAAAVARTWDRSLHSLAGVYQDVADAGVVASAPAAA
jgi:glycosyltransferase involved in cell wall biosynthesis